MIQKDINHVQEIIAFFNKFTRVYRIFKRKKSTVTGKGTFSLHHLWENERITNDELKCVFLSFLSAELNMKRTYNELTCSFSCIFCSKTMYYKKQDRPFWKQLFPNKITFKEKFHLKKKPHILLFNAKAFETHKTPFYSN